MVGDGTAVDEGGKQEEEEEEEESRRRQQRPSFMYALTAASALGGFLFGYDTGVVSGAMLLVRNRFHLDHVWHELIVSATVGAAWLFALVGGAASDRCGRKPVILGASFLFTVGAVVMGVANDKYTLLAGRIVVGAGIGLASCTIPMYIAEMSSTSQRGCLVTVNNVFITGGQFVAAMLCGCFASDREHGWRYMLGLSGVPSLIQFICFLGMPESPRWLMRHGHKEMALKVLRSIRRPSQVDDELNAIKQCCEDDASDGTTGTCSVLGRIFTTPHVRRALIVGCALQIFQQLAGINTVMYYSAPIIQMAGVQDEQEAIWLAAATAAVNFVCTFIGLYLVEKLGRRPLTLSSLFGVIISLLVLAVGFQLSDLNTPLVVASERNSSCSQFSTCSQCTTTLNCGFCYDTAASGYATNGSCIPVDTNNHALFGRCASNVTAVEGSTWAIGWCPSQYVWLVLLGLVLYLFFFAPGMGPMPWTINSEIYPLWARSTAYATATSFNWITNLFVSMTFLTFTELLTKEGTFYMYAGLATIGFVFFYLTLPETKGQDLEEVEGLFVGSWFSGRTSAASRRTVQELTNGNSKWVEINELSTQPSSTQFTVS